MLAWIDLEMTGLDPAENVIVEIATLITNNDLELSFVDAFGAGKVFVDL